MNVLNRIITAVGCATALIATVACGGDPDGAAPGHVSRAAAEILAPDTANPYDRLPAPAPDDNCQRLRINSPGPLRKVFNDSNYIHMGAAVVAGFTPVRDDGDIWHLTRPVVKVRSCAEYYLEPLTHSFPYLVPEAAQLLRDIGRSFNDSLAARGGGAYRIKVTSVLRTPATVRKLRRVNRNATEESTHSYGTTFDISWSKFICDDPAQTHRTFEDLKNLLGEVLADMHARGRCYVKFEVHQSCFHITVRPQGQPERPVRPEPDNKEKNIKKRRK